jgi:hypothetical protein
MTRMMIKTNHHKTRITTFNNKCYLYQLMTYKWCLIKLLRIDNPYDGRGRSQGVERRE